MRSARGIRNWTMVCVAMAVAAGCGGKPRVRAQRVPVEVATASQRAVPFQLVSNGTVEAIQSADVAAQVSGVITKVAFHEGDVVRKGQLLFQIDPRTFHAAHEQTLATLAKDRAQQEAALQEANRDRQLYTQKVLSQSEWDQARANADALTATVRADSAQARTAQLSVEFASVSAPIQGKTGRQLVHEGDFVRGTSGDVLVTIVQPDPIRVRFTIPEQQVPMLQRYRSSARVTISPAGEPIEGKLVFVDQMVDAMSGTLLLKGEFPNHSGLLVPGQFVDVRLVLFVSSNALVVPSQAVSLGQQGAYVYVVQPDSTAIPRNVLVDRTQDDLAVISSGLTAGERVVTDGQLRLSPGAKVLIRAPHARKP